MRHLDRDPSSIALTLLLPMFLSAGIVQAASNGTDDIPAYLLAAFKEADQNHNGTLEKPEYERYVAATFAMDDLNGDGAVSIKEMAQSLSRETGGRESAVSPGITNRVFLFFKQIDRDKDGSITLAELSPYIPVAFEGADRKRDGHLELTEVFRRFTGTRGN